MADEPPTRPQRRRRFGKPRPLDDLQRDPALLYQVGKLVGAGTMAAALLALRDDEELRRIADQLDEAMGWFFIDAD